MIAPLSPYRDNLPFFPNGAGFPQAWFSGGRLAATVLAHGGIGEILYYGRQSLGHAFFFKSGAPLSAYEKLFRLSVTIDGTAYYPEFNTTTYYPFGFTSECTLAGVRLRHELVALDDALVQRVKILSNPGRKKLGLRIVDHGSSRVINEFRTWKPWKDSSSGFVTSAIDRLTKKEIKRQIWEKTHDVRNHFPVSDTPDGETVLGLVADREHGIAQSKHGKLYFSTAPFTDQAGVALLFAPGRAAFRKRAAGLKKTMQRECDDLLALFRTRQRQAPEISIPAEPVVQSCLANIPRIIDAVEVKDIPGGFRAGMQNYWIWMDLLLDGVSFLYANDSASLRDMLLLFNGSADETRGLPVLFTTHMTPLLAAPFNNQCPFITTLYNYYCFTSDEATLCRCFPVMRWLIEKCLQTEVKGTGLLEGAGMPDHPAEQDGHDVSSCLNSYFYQALMCMRFLGEEMTRITGEPAHAEFGAFCVATAARTRKSFVRYFFDRKVGYFLDSLSSRDLSPRRHYPTIVIQWVTPFAADLVAGNEKRIADFMAREFTRPNGIGPMFPNWDPKYPGDGNQWLAYYPSWTETFFRSMMRLAGRDRELHHLFDVIRWFWQRYTIPEGFTYDAENEGLTPDNPGGKQPFGAQAWYGNFFRNIVGIEVDERGVVLSPTPIREEMSVNNLLVRGKRIDVTVTASGRAKAGVEVNGEARGRGTVVIPFAELKARNRILIRR